MKIGYQPEAKDVAASQLHDMSGWPATVIVEREGGVTSRTTGVLRDPGYDADGFLVIRLQPDISGGHFDDFGDVIEFPTRDRWESITVEAF